MKAHKASCHLSRVSYHPSGCDCPEQEYCSPTQYPLVSSLAQGRMHQVVDAASRAHAQRVEDFIRKEMERLGIGHYTPEEVRNHGWVLEMVMGFPYNHPKRLFHDPHRDQFLQLCDY